MKNSITLIRALCVVSATVFMASSASAATGDAGMSTLACESLGGERIPQPDGSAITACCFDTGCKICDENGEDCTFDTTYRDGKPTRGGYSKPVLNGGTMIIQPDTNTTVDTGANPLGGKIIRRILKQK